MYSKLEGVMLAKIWEAARQMITTFAQTYQDSQPAAVKYLQDNRFCDEWILYVSG